MTHANDAGGRLPTIKFSTLSLNLLKNVSVIPPFSSIQFPVWREFRRVADLTSPMVTQSSVLKGGVIYLVSNF